MAQQGIKFNENLQRFDTDWGWVKMNFKTNEVRVYGPNVEKWFDADRALRTASLFIDHCPSPGMAVTLAIHYQYAAWKGAQTICRELHGNDAYRELHPNV